MANNTTDNTPDQVAVLFVCLGNICRSPTAHGIFAELVQKNGLSAQIFIDSAGTGDWHIGRAPDQRAQQAALARGYDLSPLRARKVGSDDFHHFDYILAMDRENLKDLKAMKPRSYSGHLGLFLRFAATRRGPDEVPDPYYGGPQGFEQVIDLVELASQGLLEHIWRQQGWSLR